MVGISVNIISGANTTCSTSKNTPLIICAPGFKKNAKTESVVELWISTQPYAMAGIQIPEHVEGKSMVTLLTDPGQDWKKPAFTKSAGISITTADYSYTEWGGGRARMLFDLIKDPGENINVAEDPRYEEVVKKLSACIKQRAGNK